MIHSHRIDCPDCGAPQVVRSTEPAVSGICGKCRKQRAREVWRGAAMLLVPALAVGFFLLA